MLLLTQKSDLSTAVLLPRLLTPAYLTIQLLTLVIPITCLYSLHLPLIYIETLELHSKSSRSLNSPTLQSLQLWARIALPAEQSIYLLHNQSTTSFKKSLLLLPLQYLELLHFIKRTDDRPQLTDVPDWRTNWRIKSKVRNVKIRFSPSYQLDPAWPVKILKITTTNESKVNLILNQPSNWT
jgi:hypothetical protein